jgi:pyruvate,orthophosphate dikinase
MAAVPDLAVLMALRVRGRGDAAAVARTTGSDTADAGAALVRVGAQSWVAPVSAAPEGTMALTDAGRATLARLLASEPLDRTALAALYDRFLAADRALKAAVTAWQLATDADKPAARAELMASATTAGGVAAELAAVAPRLAPYPFRLADAAGAIVTGDARFVASPRVDSLHQVWFELHEDLLVTLGRSRTT